MRSLARHWVPPRRPGRVAARTAIAGVAFVLLTLVGSSLVATGASHLTGEARAYADASPCSVGCGALTAADDVTGGPVAPEGASGWVKLPGALPTGPGSRAAPALADDPADGVVLLFGGCAAACPLGDTWTYEGGSWTNLTSTLARSPPARSAAMMSYDPATRSVLLFGGRGAAGLLSDTWSFHDGIWSPVSSSFVPAARFGAGFAVLPEGSSVGQLLLVGGHGAGKTFFSDVWAFGASGWHAVPSPSGAVPPARSGAVLATDLVSGLTILFGGYGACGRPCSDTWVFAQGVWKNASGIGTLAPPARTQAAAAYDPTMGGIVMSGGRDKKVYNDTWLYRSGAWSDVGGKLAEMAPPRAAAAMAFDSVDGYLLTVGGRGVNLVRGPVWALQSPLSSMLLPSSATVSPGTSVTISGSATGGMPPYRMALDFGDGSPVRNVSAAVHTYVQPGTYRAVLTVTDALGRGSRSVATIVVAPPTLSASVSASPSPAPLGARVTLTAVAHGGLPPYAYHWDAAPAGCPLPVGAQATCTPNLVGPNPLGVTVTDASGETVSANATLLVTAVSATSVGAASPPTVSTSAPAVPSNWALVPAVAAAAVLAGIASVLFYRTARLEAEAARTRPFCYSPPEWSETPEEFAPAAIPGAPAAEASRSPLALAPTLSRSADPPPSTGQR